MSVVKICIVKGCKNVDSKINFNGPICEACADMLVEGVIVEPGPTFIHEFAARHMKMAEDFGALVEENKKLINGGTTKFKGKYYVFTEVMPHSESVEPSGEKLEVCPYCVQGNKDWNYDGQSCNYCGWGKVSPSQGEE